MNIFDNFDHKKTCIPNKKLLYGIYIAPLTHSIEMISGLKIVFFI